MTPPCAGGECTAHRGTLPNPAITIHTPSEIWLQIARGELSGQTAYMKGLYRTEGDLGLLLRMGDLFATLHPKGPYNLGLWFIYLKF